MSATIARVCVLQKHGTTSSMSAVNNTGISNVMMISVKAYTKEKYVPVVMKSWKIRVVKELATFLQCSQ